MIERSPQQGSGDHRVREMYSRLESDQEEEEHAARYPRGLSPPAQRARERDGVGGGSDHLSRVGLGEDQRLPIACLLHREFDNLRNTTAFQRLWLDGVRKGGTSFGAREVRCWRWLFGNHIPIFLTGLARRTKRVVRITKASALIDSSLAGRMAQSRRDLLSVDPWTSLSRVITGVPRS